MAYAETDGTTSTEKKEEEVYAPATKFNPYDGIERSGLIPKVELPEDITNPGRWRYVPEGRIKPGNVFQRFLVSTFIVPLFFYEKDIGAGGGVSITDIDFRQQRRREFAGIFFSYTTEGQQRYSMLWQRWLYHRNLDNGGIIFEERSYVRLRGGYERTLTRRFFGFGADTRKEDETSYTDEFEEIQLLIQRSLPEPGDNFVVQASLRGAHHNLAAGHVSDVPSTNTAFPDIFAAGDNYDILRVGASLSYDTRDSQHAPYKGWMVKSEVDTVPLQSRDGIAALYSLSGSWIQKVPGLFHDNGDPEEENPPTDVVAFGAQMGWTDGDLPFWALPSLGGRKTLRGYIENRFTGRAFWHASAEYRFWTVPRGFSVTDTMRVERLGAALFYDIGTVSNGLSGLWSETVHDSYGIGFRFSLERAAQFRADLGFSKEGTNFSFGYGHSF